MKYREMSTTQVLQMILDDPGAANRLQGLKRPEWMQSALATAEAVLPEGKGKRALGYVVNHEQAQFWPGGNDAVAPAIRQAIAILENGRWLG